MLTLAATCRILSPVNQRLVPFYPMKLRIPPRYHGPLCALGFIALMAIVALIESIGGAN